MDFLVCGAWESESTHCCCTRRAESSDVSHDCVRCLCAAGGRSVEWCGKAAFYGVNVDVERLVTLPCTQMCAFPPVFDPIRRAASNGVCMPVMNATGQILSDFTGQQLLVRTGFYRL